MKFLILIVSTCLFTNFAFSQNNRAVKKDHIDLLMTNSEFGFIGHALIITKGTNDPLIHQVTSIQIVSCDQTRIDFKTEGASYKTNLVLRSGIKTHAKVGRAKNSIEELTTGEYFGHLSCDELESLLKSKADFERLRPQQIEDFYQKKLFLEDEVHQEVID